MDGFASAGASNALAADGESSSSVFEEILWDPGALPLERRVIDGIGIEVDPRVTGKVLRACRAAQSDASLRHLKRVSSQEAQEEYKGKIPPGTMPSAEILAVAGARCDIPPGKIRILLGAAEPWPDDQPEKSADSASLRAARRQVPVLTEENLPTQLLKAIRTHSGTFVRFPFVAIPASDPLTRATESSYIWPMKPAQALAPPSAGLLLESPGTAERMMELAVKAASIGRSAGFRGCGAVVFDPMWGQMRGWAFDQTQWLGCPRPNAAEAAAEDAAMPMAAASVPVSASASATVSSSSSSSSSSADAAAAFGRGGAESVHPLHTASLLVIEAIAMADRRRRGAFDRVREAKAGLHWDAPLPSKGAAVAGASVEGAPCRHDAASAAPSLPTDSSGAASAAYTASAASPSDASEETGETEPATGMAGARGSCKRARPSNTALQTRSTSPSTDMTTDAAAAGCGSRGDPGENGDGMTGHGPDHNKRRPHTAVGEGEEEEEGDVEDTAAALAGRQHKHLTPRSMITYLHDVPVLPLPPTEPEPSVPGDDQYICTGYDVFLSVEPSAMDAMALSHSRVRSVFFATPDTTDGALVSRLRLHEAKALNHHYRVFRLDPKHALAKRAAELWASPDGEGTGNPFRCDPAVAAATRAATAPASSVIE